MIKITYIELLEKGEGSRHKTHVSINIQEIKES